MATPSQIAAEIEAIKAAQAAKTTAGQEALDFLNKYKAAQAGTGSLPGSPGFTGPPGPPAPAPQGTISRVAGATANAAKTTAGVVGRGLASVGPKALGTGVGLMLYPSSLGDGTLSSPEAQKAIAENERINRSSGSPLIASEPTGQYVNTTNKPDYMTPSPEEEAARRARSSSAIDIARPEGTARFQPGTGLVDSTPIYRTPQEADKARVAGIVSRISPENPYGVDVTSPALRTRQISVGAATDEEAARNLKSRAEQDAAVRERVAGFDRATEALRDLRAERMGIPRNILDEKEGRVKSQATAADATVTNPFALPGDSFGDDVMRKNRLMSAIESPQGKSVKQRKANQEAAIDVFKTFMEGRQQPARAPATSSVDPVNMGRFLLDQQKFGWQQGIDKSRLALDQSTLDSKQSSTALEQKKYADERRKEFISNFSYPDAKAPKDQIAAQVLSLSDATGGQIPPEIMAGYYQKAVENAGIDWAKGGPKNPVELGKQAMALAVKDYQGK